MMASCLNTVWFSRGVWNVPYVSKVYLLKGSLLRSQLTDFGLYNWHILDADMAFCHNVRNKVRADGNEPFVVSATMNANPREAGAVHASPARRVRLERERNPTGML